MSLTASVVDGVIQESSSAASLAGSSSSSSTSSAYNQDTFLQLLVAEVQNQDPLEPTSNTEWVSQYATFSQLESMNNMSASYELSRASALVGQTVQIKVTSSTGTTSIYQGKVDYVTYEENKAYLSVNGSLYSLEDVYNVIDTEYIEAYETAYNWATKVAELPTTTNLTLSDQEAVEELYNEYQEMDSYTKSFIDEDTTDLITADYEKIQELVKQAEEAEAALLAAAEAEEEEEEKTEVEETVTETETTSETTTTTSDSATDTSSEDTTDEEAAAVALTTDTTTDTTTDSTTDDSSETTEETTTE